MSYNVILATTLSDEAMAILRQAEDINLQSVAPKREAIQAYLAQAHALIVGDELGVDAQMINEAEALILIGRAGASLTDIDVEAATRRGIIVMNTPGVDAVTVAEYAFGLLLALVRNIVRAHNDILDGVQERAMQIGTQLKGKTLGIIGFGRVGREMAQRGMAFGMEIIAADPYVSESQVADLRMKLVGMDELLARSDVITLHSSLVPATENLINAESLALMKSGVFLINIKDSRLVAEDDLLAALASGQVAGYATDVFNHDPSQSRLFRHSQVIHTSRMRDNTHEAQRDLSVLIAGQVIDALREQDYRNVVNLPFMPGQEYDRISHQLTLAERIGILLHHLGHQAPIKRISIEISGQEMHGLLKPLTVAILKGMLQPTLGDRVNYINAPVIAAERGIPVTQGMAISLHSYPNLLSCQVLWDDGGELVVAGALFNETEPRIVQVDRYRTDFTPDGTLLIMGSYDVPGVIGRAGTFMADHQINIAGWRTSRVEKGGNTLSIISIDEPLEMGLMDEFRAHEFVRHLRQITF